MTEQERLDREWYSRTLAGRIELARRAWLELLEATAASLARSGPGWIWVAGVGVSWRDCLCLSRPVVLRIGRRLTIALGRGL